MTAKTPSTPERSEPAAAKTASARKKTATASEAPQKTDAADKAAPHADESFADMFKANEKFATMFTEAQERFQSLFQKANFGTEAWRDAAEDASYAMRAYSEAAQNGAKDLSEDLIDFMQKEMTRFADYAEQFMRVKSVNDLAELNRAFLTETVETRLEKARELNTKSIDAARRTMEPINNTISAAMNRAGDIGDAWTPND